MKTERIDLLEKLTTCAVLAQLAKQKCTAASSLKSASKKPGFRRKRHLGKAGQKQKFAPIEKFWIVTAQDNLEFQRKCDFWTNYMSEPGYVYP